MKHQGLFRTWLINARGAVMGYSLYKGAYEWGQEDMFDEALKHIQKDFPTWLVKRHSDAEKAATLKGNEAAKYHKGALEACNMVIQKLKDLR